MQFSLIDLEMNGTCDSMNVLFVSNNNNNKTQNPLKFVGVPQTPEPISAVSGPKFTKLSGHVDEVLLLNNFFSDCRYMP